MHAIESRTPVLEPVADFMPLQLTVCSLCLKVVRDGEWVAAETAIRAMRTYDRSPVPALHPGICPDCASAIARRRLAK
jgi:hypothetical protein